MAHSHNTRAAFTLIELSIVIVIIGLLVGGILGGQALIRNSGLKAVVSEFQKYKGTVVQFKDQYNGLPGDMANATGYWGRMNGNADCATNSGAAISSSNGACDGNSNSRIELAGAAGGVGELYQFWRQLSLAGFIEGNYTGTSGAGSTFETLVGINAPASKLTPSGWSVYYVGTFGGSNFAYAGTYGHYLGYGRPISGSITVDKALTPTEAWNIDSKIDDGMSGTGFVLSRSAVVWSGTGACTTSTSATDYAGNYNLGYNDIACGLFFRNQFNEVR